MNTKLVSTIETIGLSILGFGLAQIAAHAADLSPQYGALIGVVATTLVNLVNGLLAKPASPDGPSITPVQQIVSLAFKGEK